MLLSIAAAAQEPAEPPPTAPRLDEGQLNYPFLSTEGGFYSLTGNSVQVVRVPLGLRLRRSSPEGRWGARLTLPVSFGVHRLELDDVQGGRTVAVARRTLQTITLIPGVELQVPVTERWELKPFAEAGFGMDFEGGAGAALYGVGLRTIYRRPWRDLELRVGTEGWYRGASLIDGGSDGYGALVGGFEVRRPLPWRRIPDGSLYAIQKRFVPDVELRRPGRNPQILDRQTEVGVTLGLDAGWNGGPKWLESLRIGVGYRVGDGFDSIRLLFGDPF